MKIILAITFVYGVIRLLSFTKIFDLRLIGLLETILTEPNPRKLYGIIIIYLDYLIFYSSLSLQSWYWLFK